MMYVRGPDRDYNQWAALGNRDWDFESVLPYFKKSEDNTDQSIVDYTNGRFHGTKGYLKVSNFNAKDPFIDVLRSAYAQIGVKENRDVNSGEHVGFVKVQGTVYKGERVSAARAFLLPIRDRKNLKVMKGSFVNKILFNGTSAIGVNVLTKNKQCENIKIYARKEVIISAGSFNTPKILLQSGIGRIADLRPFGIPQIKDLAVGDNFLDHPAVLLFMKMNGDGSLFDIFVDLWDYFFKRSGSFADLGSTTYHGFVNTLNNSAVYPDIHLEIFRASKGLGDFLKTSLEIGHYIENIIDELVEANKDSDIVFIHIVALSSKGKGTVKLQSDDPWDDPKIMPHFYEIQDDVDKILRGISKVRELIDTPALQVKKAELIRFDLPECDSFPYASAAYDRCYLTYFGTSGRHPVGTCKMGPLNDTDAVVDEKLKVHGMKNLRVVDASIIPINLNANTQATVYMIGEKASDMIKEDWRSG